MSNEISKALRQMVFEMEDQITQTTLEDSLERSAKIADIVTEAYQNFFQTVQDILEEIEFDKDENFSPGGESALSLAKWTPLSEYWKGEKARYNEKATGSKVTLPFYHGITKFRRRQPFIGYISSLAKSKNSVNRFFGPARIEYKISSPKGSTTITQPRGKVRFRASNNPPMKTGGRKEYITSVGVQVFPKLIDVIGRGRIGRDTEWRVVDAMIKANGSRRAYKQLVKINGQYGKNRRGGLSENRPIRPLITPIIAMEIYQMRRLIDGATKRNL